MGVEEYSIGEAWKHEDSSPHFSADLEDAYGALEGCPIPEIILPELRQERIDFELEDNRKATMMFIDGVCDEHNLSISVPDQPEEGNTIVYLVPESR